MIHHAISDTIKPAFSATELRCLDVSADVLEQRIPYV